MTSEDDVACPLVGHVVEVGRDVEIDVVLDLESCLSDDVSEEVVFLDSCATKTLFILRDQSWLEFFTHEVGHIKTTKAGETVTTQGVGNFRDFKGVRVCNDAVKNLIGAGYLRQMGYGLMLLSVPKIVRLDNMEVVLVAEYHENGMPYVELVDLLDLPNIISEQGGEEVLLTDDMGEDQLDLLHRRAAHFSRSVVIEAYRRRLISGTGLQRKHLSKTYQKKNKCLCKACALSKIKRESFHEKPEEAQL
jgi:hypothetical protein